jgi:hypothetical protein
MMVQPQGNGESGMTGPSSLTSNIQIKGTLWFEFAD